jgi:arylsulfatase
MPPYTRCSGIRYRILHSWRGRLSSLGQPFTCLRTPKVFNLRMDVFERADIVQTSLRLEHQKCLPDPIWCLEGRPFLGTYKEYPPSQ